MALTLSSGILLAHHRPAGTALLLHSGSLHSSMDSSRRPCWLNAKVVLNLCKAGNLSQTLICHLGNNYCTSILSCQSPLK